MLMLLPIHIAAAGLGLIAGAVALFAVKGGRLHRKSGMLFVCAIAAMCGTATVMAVVKGQAVNVMAALMTAYLAITALTTVRPPAAGSRRRDVALMLMALVLGLATIATGFAAIASVSGKMFGYRPFPFFLFGVLGLSGAFGDFRTIRSDGLRGAPRLSRHLWRMCMALGLRPYHSSPLARAWPQSFRRRSPLRCCVRFPCCSCLWRCSIGCGASASAGPMRTLDGQAAPSATAA